MTAMSYCSSGVFWESGSLNQLRAARQIFFKIKVYSQKTPLYEKNQNWRDIELENQYGGYLGFF